MTELKEFELHFSGLKNGIHKFNFEISDKFFEAFNYSEFNEAGIEARVRMEKKEQMLELKFNTTGSINVNCDRTLEPFNLPVKADWKLLVKFGEIEKMIDDDVLVLPYGSHKLNISQYLYEMIVLSVPPRRVHPGIKDGSLDSEILRKLELLNHTNNKKDNNQIDPRWETLKKLSSENK